MNSIEKNIELIIDELVDSSKKLSEILFKIQLVSMQLGNDVMKDWVEAEINGYEHSKDVPEYRYISSYLKCTLIKDYGFQGTERIQNFIFPLDKLDEYIQKFINNRPIFNSISEMECMGYGKFLLFQYPSELIKIIQYQLENNVVVENVSCEISFSTIKSLLNKLRLKLLTFFMELKDSNIDLKNYSMKNDNEKVKDILAKNFGDLHANNVSISIGDKNNQNSNFGEGIQNNNFYKKENDYEIVNLLNEIKKCIDKLNLSIEDKEDLTNELQRVDKQLNRENPKVDIINTGLETIKGILLGVTTNAYTPIILNFLGIKI